MSARYVFSSVTRIATFDRAAFEIEVQPPRDWRSGDYVVGQVIGVSGPLRYIELTSGRMAEIGESDLIVGALGQRAATLEACGDWKAIDADLRMHALTSAGLFGKETSKSPYVPELISLAYRGHVVLGGRCQRMSDFAVCPLGLAFELPVVLVIGTSMSAGKTTACRVIVRERRSAVLKVAGAKITGAARYRDVLAMFDAGADHVFDFVDAGLPSTVCEEMRFRDALAPLLEHIGNSGADVLVAGGAANTEAGAELVARLTGLEALNLLHESSIPRLRTLLQGRLGYRFARP